MIKRLSLLIILLTIFSPVVARAEGSRELTQYDGSRPFLDARTDFFNGIPRRNLIKVYVQAGEVLQLGSSAIGIGNGNIIATAPNGNVLNCRTSQPGNGVIANRTQELAGPGDGTGNTFIPCSTTVTAAQAGIWEIQFLAPSNSNPSTQDPTTIAANGNWPTQAANNSFVTAWDVTVRNSSGQVQTGRAFANSLALNTNLASLSSLPQVNSRLFVQTQDGYLYNVNLNGLQPVGFIFFSNQNGFIDASGKPIYRSVDAPSGATNLTNPPSDDNFTHKLFFNQPDSSLPPTANSPSGNTWLKPITVKPPQPSDLKFFGKEGTENQTGTNPLQGNFRFFAPEARPFTISIDINDNGSFIDPIDRVIIGTATVGTNTVAWDGKNGLGNDVPPSALGYRAQVKLYGGEVHFPLLDPERNPNGLIINRLTPVAGVSGDPTYNPDWMYYDDSGFFDPNKGVEADPIKLLTGGSSSLGIHKFAGNQPASGNPPNSQTNPEVWWGNVRGIDTWAFVPSLPVELNGRIRVLQADLNITKTLTSPNTTPNNPITYTITVTNNGPSNVTGVGVRDILPTQIENATWTCAITGTGLCPTPSGSANIETTVNLNNGAVATFLVSGTLASGATGAINNSATVTRPKDVADPVDQDRSGGTNETETATTTFSGLGIAKQAGGVTANGDGTFSIPYTLVITNTTSFAFSNLQVTEDLKATFGNSSFTIVPASLTASGGLTVNSSFNGGTDQNLLAANNTLPANTTRTIQFTVTVPRTSSAPPYQNTARVSGTTPGGVVVTDDSTDGPNPDPDGNGNPSDNSVPTVVNFNVPRLGVAKTVGTPTIVSGNQGGVYWIPYTVTVKNLGTVPITNLQVTDNLTATPGTLIFPLQSISSPTLTVNPNFNNNTDRNLLAGTDTLAVGQTAQITFYVELNLGTNPGSVSNQATGTGNSSAGLVSDISTNGTNPDPDGDGNPNNNSDPTVVSITQNPVLGVAKSAGLPINNNDGSYTIRYILTLANLGNVAINNLQVTDNLSSTFNNSVGTVPFSVETGSISSPTLTVKNTFDGRNILNLLDGTDPLAVGQTAQISFNVRITPGKNNGPFNNTATAKWNTSAGEVSDVSTNGTNPDPDGNGNPSENQATVVNIPRLGVAKAAGNPVNNNNGTYTIPYTLVVKNMGNVAINNLQVSDDLSTTFGNNVPFEILSGSIIGSIGSTALSVNSGFTGRSPNQNLLLGTDNLAVGATAEIKFNVVITPGTSNGPFNNTATANGNTSAGPVSDASTDGADPDQDNDGNSANDGDGNPNNNNQATVVNIPRLGVAKSAGTPVNNNDGTYRIPYTLVVKNMGNVAINNLQVSDDLRTTFGTVPFEIVSGSVVGSTGLTVNGGFNGKDNNTLLAGSDTLPVNTTAQITFNVRITPGSSLGPFNNTATAKGTTPGGAQVTDDSTDGADPDQDNDGNSANDGDGNPGNNSVATSVQLQGIPNLRLVKRVTRINQTPLANVVDDLNDLNDNASSWPGNYLQGQINVPDILPGDVVEYTIYFMSDGSAPANNVRICDRIPQDQTFVPDHFAVGRGSAVQFGTNTPTPLTNANDSDSGTFFPINTTIDINLCSGPNTNGALIWNLGNIPSNTNPINYGFVRFRARVK